MQFRDTIFAVASARGRAGIAVLRVSGPGAFDAVRALAVSLPKARTSSLRWLRDPVTGEVLDQALVLTFAEGHSFTGECVAEFQVHGSVAVQAALLATLSAVPGFRLAEPGEFSRRALENGRMDLAQIEGLGDLISAETSAQHRAAMQVMQGALSERVSVWRRDLLQIAAQQAAMIDFADEDVPDLAPEILQRIQLVSALLAAELQGSFARTRLRDGFEVAIVGRPNVGKSTLLNALAGREAALTSEIAGTTRDVIEVRMDLAGLPVTLLDTAGLRETSDQVEIMGVERARERASLADLRVFLLEPDALILPDQVAFQDGDIRVIGKADLAVGSEDLSVSGKTGYGIDRLLERIAAILSERIVGTGLIIRERHRVAIRSALSGLDRAADRVRTGIGSDDLAAEDVLAAIRALDSIIGRIDVEQVLGEIFASFCIGK